MKAKNSQDGTKVKSYKWLSILVVVLLVLICVSGSILITFLSRHSVNDSYVIQLVMGTRNEVSTASESSSGTRIKREEVLSNPNLEIKDSVKTWSNNTEINIFKESYTNSEGSVTVNGGEDKVIAPGTGNSYCFTLKNSGDIIVDYVLTLEAYSNQPDISLPIEVRLSGYDGSYLLGSEVEWVNFEELNEVKDSASLEVNNYASYNLEWRWVYETNISGDMYDTLIGSSTVEDDVDITLVIHTVTTAEDVIVKETIIEGIFGSPDTGDYSISNTSIISLIAILMLTVVLIIVVKRRKEEEKDEKQ